MFCCFASFSWGQSVPERKIIVQDGHYYYVSIHPYLQVGTLHILESNDTLDAGSAYALPAGRSYFEPVNPLAWDIEDTSFYVINFLDHPLNDKNEAIKRFSTVGLKQWKEGLRPEDMIMISVDYNLFAYNDPYRFILNRSKILTHFFFDGIWWNEAYWMVITNNDELSVWKYTSANGWQHGDVLLHPVNGYFSLFVHDNKLNLITNNGDVFGVSLESLSLLKKAEQGIVLNEGVLVENRDRDKVLFLPSSAINKSVPLKKSIDQFAITIY